MSQSGTGAFTNIPDAYEQIRAGARIFFNWAKRILSIASLLGMVTLVVPGGVFVTNQIKWSSAHKLYLQHNG